VEDNYDLGTVKLLDYEPHGIPTNETNDESASKQPNKIMIRLLNLMEGDDLNIVHITPHYCKGG
jgi:hypothetical protein